MMADKDIKESKKPFLILKKQEQMSNKHACICILAKLSVINSRITEKTELGRPNAFQAHQRINQLG
jgi:hypothetical protein